MASSASPIELHEDDTTGPVDGAMAKGQERSSLERALPRADRPVSERAASRGQALPRRLP
ncbi:MAG: hypothetical protein CL931_15085 [Deltaproteobacteria bacterium]|nr:hypothetical protein [Deltaproteobacteria bacterium]